VSLYNEIIYIQREIYIKICILGKFQKTSRCHAEMHQNSAIAVLNRQFSGEPVSYLMFTLISNLVLKGNAKVKANASYCRFTEREKLNF